MRHAGFLTLTLVTALQFVAAGQLPPTVVVLKDGTRYTLSKAYEVRGSQARLLLVNGTLVSVRASEIDVEASKRASTLPTAARSPAPPATASSAEVGTASPQPASKDSLGSRVRVDKELAGRLFRQDVVPTPTPHPVTTTTPGAAVGTPNKDADADAEKLLTETMKANAEDERRWRAREAERLSRLETARESQREICARYVAALNSAGTQDGWVSDSAGAILGALKADCDTASRKVDVIVAERERLEEECRKTYGCQPGWLR